MFACLGTKAAFQTVRRPCCLQVLALHDVSSTDASIIYTAEPVLGAGFAYLLLGGHSAPKHRRRNDECCCAEAEGRARCRKCHCSIVLPTYVPHESPSALVCMYDTRPCTTRSRSLAVREQVMSFMQRS